MPAVRTIAIKTDVDALVEGVPAIDLLNAAGQSAAVLFAQEANGLRVDPLSFSGGLILLGWHRAALAAPVSA